MTKAACWAAVFNTAELLELIVLYLPARTILTRASLVSKSWNKVIRTSPTIRKRLWQNPQATGTWSPDGLTESDDELWLEGVTAGDRFTALFSGLPVYTGAYQMNPFMPTFPSQRRRHCDGVPRFPALPVKWDFLEKCWTTIPERPGRCYVQMTMALNKPSEATSEIPTWLDMHLIEPPISTVWVEVSAIIDWGRIESRTLRSLPPGPGPVHATVRDNSGVTFRLVRNVADKMAAQPAYERFAREHNPVTIKIVFVADRLGRRLSMAPEN